MAWNRVRILIEIHRQGFRPKRNEPSLGKNVVAPQRVNGTRIIQRLPWTIRVNLWSRIITQRQRSATHENVQWMLSQSIGNRKWESVKERTGWEKKIFLPDVRIPCTRLQLRSAYRAFRVVASSRYFCHTDLSFLRVQLRDSQLNPKIIQSRLIGPPIRGYVQFGTVYLAQRKR